MASPRLNRINSVQNSAHTKLHKPVTIGSDYFYASWLNKKAETDWIFFHYEVQAQGQFNWFDKDLEVRHVTSARVFQSVTDAILLS